MTGWGRVRSRRTSRSPSVPDASAQNWVAVAHRHVAVAGAAAAREFGGSLWRCSSGLHAGERAVWRGGGLRESRLSRDQPRPEERQGAAQPAPVFPRSIIAVIVPLCRADLICRACARLSAGGGAAKQDDRAGRSRRATGRGRPRAASPPGRCRGAACEGIPGLRAVPQFIQAIDGVAGRPDLRHLRLRDRQGCAPCRCARASAACAGRSRPGPRSRGRPPRTVPDRPPRRAGSSSPGRVCAFTSAAMRWKGLASGARWGRMLSVQFTVA